MSVYRPAAALSLNSQRLAGTPAVRRGERWWLTSGSGAVLATDPAFTSRLDHFATALAAADRSVAGLRTRQVGEQ